MITLDTKAGSIPWPKRAYECLISLPMFHGMTDDDIEDVVRALSKVLAHFER